VSTLVSGGRTLVSTTSNHISGDVHLGLSDKLKYLLGCVSNNYLGRIREPQRCIPSIHLELPPIGRVQNELCLTSSPSRFYSDVLWRSFPWEKVRDALGKVKILEIGCGSGSRFQLFSEVFKASLVRYIGIDICFHPEWSKLQQKDARVHFVQMRAEDVSREIFAFANLIVSQSVLEHVEGDLEFFISQRSAMLLGTKVIQIHVVPALISLFLYLWHGYRQYSTFSFGEIATNYPDARCALIRLGGVWSNLLHLLTITLPSLMHIPQLRHISKSLYLCLLHACYARERFLNSRVPSFYALVVETGFKRHILAC